MAMDKILLCTVLLCIALSTVQIIEAAPKGSLVTNLPGFNGAFPSKHYSGYVTIDGQGDSQKNLFYYFVVSQRNPRKDPLVLWLNGGPGCSSFDGFVYEHGPFNFEAGKSRGSLPKLHPNPYSWSKVSNIIYLDSPAGVGLSYSKNVTTYQNGDLQTAIDTHKFLLGWLRQFSEFSANPFYISGESYAGVYVPTLASEIDKGNKGSAKPIINLKGYIIGNGVTDEKFDGNALVPFARGMGLISDVMYKRVKAACNASYYNPTTESCAAGLAKLDTALQALNVYDILEPCYHSPGENSSSSLPSSFQQLGVTERLIPVRKRMFGRAWPFRAPVKDGIIPSWPVLMSNAETNAPSVPCVNVEVATAWLNDDEVRKAIHASPEIETRPWAVCTNLVYNHDAGSMIKYHKKLTGAGYRALIYSGDHDMCVPFTGSQAWTGSLGYKTVDEWRPWLSNEQVAGFLQGYAHNLTFLTIKGAGHTVPEYKPREAFDFYSRWLDGKSI